MAKDINDKESITSYIQKLEPEFGAMIEEIRQIILSTDNEIGEQIKWNSPSFFYMGQMKEFNPKEYKRDIIVINIRKEIALLVFPTGAKINDTTGILEGNYTDGRRLVTFKNIEEVKSRKNALQHVIKEWLKMVEKP